MNHNELLVAIYDHRLVDGGFYLIHSFDQKGNLEREILEKLYQELHAKELASDRHDVGPFNSLEELQRFSFTLCQQLDSHGIYIIPTQDFSIILEKINSIQEFWQTIRESNFLLENPDKTSKKGWKKIFT